MMDWNKLKIVAWLNGIVALRVIVLIPYSVQQSPSWEANRFSASQKIPRIL